MSNIISDLNRQTIALEIIQTVQPQCYVDVGCYQGASISWWIRNIPKVFGCDINSEAVAECLKLFPTANLTVADSRDWLFAVQLPQPAVFYLDTDWVPDLAKLVELRIIIARFPESVIISNAINRPGHPLYMMTNRPWDMDELFAEFGKHFRQFIAPKYGWPVLQQGYAVMNGTDKMLRFDPNLFTDLLNPVHQ